MSMESWLRVSSELVSMSNSLSTGNYREFRDLPLVKTGGSRFSGLPAFLPTPRHFTGIQSVFCIRREDESYPFKLTATLPAHSP